MTNVLFITTERPPVSALDDVCSELRRRGTNVQLATYFDPDDIAASLHLDDIRRVQFYLSTVGGRKVRRLTPQWLWVLVSNPWRRRRLRRADAILRPWLLAKTDLWLRERALGADVIVALDSNSVYCVWKLAKLNPHAQAVRGLYEALEALKETDPPDLVALAHSSEREQRDN